MAEFEIVYWHWIVLGLLLMAAEIITPTFMLLCVGAGAVVVGFVLLFVPISLTVQIMLWATLSVVFLFLWFQFIRPLSIDKTKAGLASENIINETGMVIKLPVNGKKGMLRFSVPKLGNEEWEFMTEDVVAEGDRVRVVSVSGNSLIVIKA